METPNEKPLRDRLVWLMFPLAVFALLTFAWFKPAPGEPVLYPETAPDAAGDPVKHEDEPLREQAVVEAPLHARAAGSQLSGYGDYDPHYDLQLVADLLDSYRVLVKGAGKALPSAADNAELVRTLIGHNPDLVQLLPPESPHIDPSGRLVDQWGTPLHFHFVSSSCVEIRSAGPDKNLWSADDFTKKIGEGHPWL